MLVPQAAKTSEFASAIDDSEQDDDGAAEKEDSDNGEESIDSGSDSGGDGANEEDSDDEKSIESDSNGEDDGGAKEEDSDDGEKSIESDSDGEDEEGDDEQQGDRAPKSAKPGAAAAATDAARASNNKTVKKRKAEATKIPSARKQSMQPSASANKVYHIASGVSSSDCNGTRSSHYAMLCVALYVCDPSFRHQAACPSPWMKAATKRIETTSAIWKTR